MQVPDDDALLDASFVLDSGSTALVATVRGWSASGDEVSLSWNETEASASVGWTSRSVERFAADLLDVRQVVVRRERRGTVVSMHARPHDAAIDVTLVLGSRVTAALSLLDESPRATRSGATRVAGLDVLADRGAVVAESASGIARVSVRTDGGEALVTSWDVDDRSVSWRVESSAAVVLRGDIEGVASVFLSDDPAGPIVIEALVPNGTVTARLGLADVVSTHVAMRPL